MARRGFAVTVFEKEEKAGGQVKTASTCLLKGKLYWSIEDLMANVEKLGVEVKLGTEATEKAIAKLKPYAVVIATGKTALNQGHRPAQCLHCAGDHYG